MVELGLLAIKALKLLGRLLTTTFRLVAGFFAFIFNFLFKRVLVKIYFEIFRLKKSYSPDKKSNNILNLLKKNLAFFSIILLTLVSIFTNILNKKQASAAGTQVSKTIMADLIKNQFSSLYQEGDELITDSYIPSMVEGGDKHDKDYLDTIIEKNSGLINETKDANLNTLANEDALAIKPEGISTDSDKLTSSNTVTSKRNKIISYTVTSGDTVSSIAKQFGITINTVLWANNLGAYSLIRPGDELNILPESGVIHNVKSGDTISKIANTYDIAEKDILASNELGAVLKIGDKIMVPGGTKLKAAVASRPKTTSNTGLSIIRDLVKTPDAPSSTDTSQKMLWPTEGHRITQYFSWSHTGLDIANKTGTPLYASEAGTVEYSGWSNGYGYNVLINHGGGKKTRYAHASKLFVKAGDSVSRGENIAAMGSTGWSTGPHIHFEVIINGKKYNPLNYIN